MNAMPPNLGGSHKLPQRGLAWDNLVLGLEGPLNRPFAGVLNTPSLVAVEGPNGCGKSTLLKTFGGLVKPFGGHVQCSLKKVGYVPQAHSINPYFPIEVATLVAQGLGPHPLKKEGFALVHDHLERWGVADVARRSFHTLSLGQKTRALVARALVGQPQLLLLDEPLASLDSCCQSQLMGFLAQWCTTAGALVLVVDHHLEPYQSLFQHRLEFRWEHNQRAAYVAMA